MGYQIMFYGGLILSIVSLTLAILTFIKYRIKQVIADLIGSKLLKTRKSGQYHYEANLTESGKRTTSDIDIKKNQSLQLPNELIDETELLNEASLLDDPEKPLEKETELISDSDETTLLDKADKDFTVDEEMLLVDSIKVIENGGEKIV